MKVRIFAPKDSERAMTKSGVELPFLFFDIRTIYAQVIFLNNHAQKEMMTRMNV